MAAAAEPRGRGRPAFALGQQLAAFEAERSRRKHAYQAQVADIEASYQTHIRMCKTERSKTAMTARVEMRLRYVAVMYTRAKELARQELDRVQGRVRALLVAEAALEDAGASAPSSQGASAPSAHGAALPTLDYADFEPTGAQSQDFEASGQGALDYARGALIDLDKAYVRADDIFFMTQRNTMIRGARGPVQITLHSDGRNFVPLFLCNRAARPMNLEFVVDNLCRMPPHRRAPTCKSSKRDGGRVLYLATFVTWLHALVWRHTRAEGAAALKSAFPEQSDALITDLMQSLVVFKIGIGAGDRALSEYQCADDTFTPTHGASRTASLNQKIRGFAKTRGRHRASPAWRETYQRLFDDVLLRTHSTPAPESSQESVAAHAPAEQVYLMKSQVVMLAQKMMAHGGKLQGAGSVAPEALEQRIRSKFRTQNCLDPDSAGADLPFLGEVARGIARSDAHLDEHYAINKEYFQVQWGDSETLEQAYARMTERFNALCMEEPAAFSGNAVVWYNDAAKPDSFPWAAASDKDNDPWCHDARATPLRVFQLRERMAGPREALQAHTSARAGSGSESGSDADPDNYDSDENIHDPQEHVDDLEIRLAELERLVLAGGFRQHTVKQDALTVFRSVRKDTAFAGLVWTWRADASADTLDIIDCSSPEGIQFKNELDQGLVARDKHIQFSASKLSLAWLLHQHVSHASAVETEGGFYVPVPSKSFRLLQDFAARYGPTPLYLDVSQAAYDATMRAAMTQAMEQKMRLTDKVRTIAEYRYSEDYPLNLKKSDTAKPFVGRYVLYFFEDFNGFRGWFPMRVLPNSVVGQEKKANSELNRVLSHNWENGKLRTTHAVDMKLRNYGIEDRWVLLDSIARVQTAQEGIERRQPTAARP